MHWSLKQSQINGEKAKGIAKKRWLDDIRQWSDNAKRLWWS